MNWVVESSVFRDYRLPAAARAAGHNVVEWGDAWWHHRDKVPPLRGPTVFHGSLGNAARVRDWFHQWTPASFCDVKQFEWYQVCHLAGQRLLNRECLRTTADKLVAEPPPWPRVFIRPSSPLKEFSGRVLDRDKITLASLDHGFYYDDPFLSVVAAPARNIGREWRYVIVDRKVVAGSAYLADGRMALQDDPKGPSWAYASKAASEMLPPEPVYVMDVCECEGRLWILELNPFSGADLYACDADAVVRAVASHLGA